MARLECNRRVKKSMSYAKQITLPHALERKPPPFEGNDIKSPESLARFVIENYSKKDGKVFDPFTGLGTTLFVAEERERTPFGMETDGEKYEWVAAQLENWMQLINDDAAKSDQYGFPKMDLVFTAPPFMAQNHKWNPLYNGDPKKAGYDKYLKRMGVIFKKMIPLMKTNTHLVIQVDNIKQGKVFTPLIHDLVACLKPSFKQVDEINVKWDNSKEDYSYTTLVVFKKK
ncbi:MAG: site-specific DNA-methyltransferase [Micavibrio sp.]|nr:site-specific DNA-methyltransferase [Micavibrio sp.]